MSTSPEHARPEPPEPPPLARKWHFYVDVVGGCNLRCPSCPVGNSPEATQPKGAMTPELLDRIVRKAMAECGRVKFDLYNWTEPFLHPRLPEMIRVVRGHGLTCGLSSNLNILRRIDDVLAADPTDLKVSLSGFEQAQYGVTHKRGDIELVKRHMAELAEAKARTGARTRLEVAFHRYLDNYADEAQMRAYAEGLGFEFDPVWAFLMPLEKALAFAEPGSTPTEINAADRDLIDRLALPLDGALAAAREKRDLPCKLRDEQMTLTCTGEVMLCCSVYDTEHYALGAYLDHPIREFQRRKYAHSQCESCMNQGVHVLYTGASDKLDALALENVRKHHPGVELESTLVRSRTRRRGIRSWPRKLAKAWRRALS